MPAKKSAKKNTQNRLFALYIGIALIILFLALVSLAPQISQKLGLFSAKKQSQESQAANYSRQLQCYDKEVPDGAIAFMVSTSPNALTPQNARKYTCDGRKQNKSNDGVDISVPKGSKVYLSWVAQNYKGWKGNVLEKRKGIFDPEPEKTCEIRIPQGGIDNPQQLREILQDGKTHYLDLGNRNAQGLDVIVNQPTIFLLSCRGQDKFGNEAIGLSEVRVNAYAVRTPGAGQKFSPCYPLGDVSNNQVIDEADTILIQRHLDKKITLTQDQLARADVDGSGAVDKNDITAIKNFLVGVTSTFRGCSKSSSNPLSQYQPQPPTGLKTSYNCSGNNPIVTLAWNLTGNAAVEVWISTDPTTLMGATNAPAGASYVGSIQSGIGETSIQWSSNKQALGRNNTPQNQTTYYWQARAIGTFAKSQFVNGPSFILTCPQ